MVALGRQKRRVQLAVIVEEDCADNDLIVIPGELEPQESESSKEQTSIQRQIDGSSKKPFSERVIIKCDENSDAFYENISEVIKRSRSEHVKRSDTPCVHQRYENEQYQENNCVDENSNIYNGQKNLNFTIETKSDRGNGSNRECQHNTNGTEDIHEEDAIRLIKVSDTDNVNLEIEHVGNVFNSITTPTSSNSVSARTGFNKFYSNGTERRENSDSHANSCDNNTKREDNELVLKYISETNKISSEVKREKYSEINKGSSNVDESDSSDAADKESKTTARNSDGSYSTNWTPTSGNTHDNNEKITGNLDVQCNLRTQITDEQYCVSTMKKLRSSSSSKNKQKGESKPKNESCRSSKERRARSGVPKPPASTPRSVSCETLIMDQSPHDWDDWGTNESKKGLSAVSRRRILERRTLAAGDGHKMNAKPKFIGYQNEDIYSAGPIDKAVEFMNYRDEEFDSSRLTEKTVKYTSYHDEEIYSAGLVALESTEEDYKLMSPSSSSHVKQPYPKRKDNAFDGRNSSKSEDESEIHRKQNSEHQTKSRSKTFPKSNSDGKHRNSSRNSDENVGKNEKSRRLQSTSGQQLESSNFCAQLGVLSSSNRSFEGKYERREESHETAAPYGRVVDAEYEGAPVTVSGKSSNETSWYAQEGASDGSPCTRRLRSAKLSDADTKSLLENPIVDDEIHSDGTQSDTSEDIHGSVATAQRTEEKVLDDDREQEQKKRDSTRENFQSEKFENKSSINHHSQQPTEEGTELEEQKNTDDNLFVDNDENIYDDEKDLDISEPLYDVIDNVLRRTIDETFAGIEAGDDEANSEKTTSDLGEDEELYQTPSELREMELDQTGQDPITIKKIEKYDTRSSDAQEILQNIDLVIIEKDSGPEEDDEESQLLNDQGTQNVTIGETPEIEAQITENEVEIAHREDQVGEKEAKIIDIQAAIAGNEEEITGDEALVADQNLENIARDTVGRVRSIFEHSALRNEPGLPDRRFHSIRASTTSRRIEICKSDASSQTFPRRPLNDKNSTAKLRLKPVEAPKNSPPGDKETASTKTPCHVLRITAEIAEYQRRSEDIKRMASLASGCLKGTKTEPKDANPNGRNEMTTFNDVKTSFQGSGMFGSSNEAAKQGSENGQKDTKSKLETTSEPRFIDKSSIGDTKTDIINELNATLQGRQSGAIETGDEKSLTTSFLEHSKILEKLKQSKEAGHETPRKSQPRESVTTSGGKTVHLRKPVLAKGFNVQKALQDKPRDFHVREHRALSKYYSSDTRIRSKSASAIPADGGGGDGESVSSETSDDSGVSNDSSMSSKSSQVFKKSSKKLTNVTDESSPLPSNAYLGDTVDFARKADTDDYDDTSIKWIDPEVLAKIRSVGTTVIFFGKRTTHENAVPGNATRHNKEAVRPGRRPEGTGDSALREKCRRYDTNCAKESTETDVKPRKSTSGAGSPEINLNHHMRGNDSGPSRNLIDATVDIKFVEKLDDGNYTRRSFQSGTNARDEEPIYGNLPSTRRGGSAEFDFQSSISGGEDVRKQLELVLKTELRKCNVGGEVQNRNSLGNFSGISRKHRNVGSHKQNEDRFTLGNCSGRFRDYPEPEAYGSCITSDDWNTRTYDGRSVTRIRIRQQETEEREAVMQLASETDTESSSSSGSTPRVVSIVRKE
ncbi:hypothetical protein FHG87_004075 [Trinorchestia longiramus]|nr:hypothetical protein FHG87_004075 [Trinorchestia longiramus]